MITARAACLRVRGGLLACDSGVAVEGGKVTSEVLEPGRQTEMGRLERGNPGGAG